MAGADGPRAENLETLTLHRVRPRLGRRGNTAATDVQNHDAVDDSESQASTCVHLESGYRTGIAPVAARSKSQLANESV
jgi:hypothetical protein